MQSVQNTWYVQVGGQAYGPYDTAQMRGFVLEGRINAQSLLSQHAMQGYAPANQFPAFIEWSSQSAPKSEPVQVLRPMSNVDGGVLARQIQPASQIPQALAPNPAPARHGQTAPQALAQNIANTVIVVMAEIRSGQGMQFLQALQAQGTAQRIGDSVWLLQCGTTVEQLRNQLSQALTRDDRLFLLDSFKNETAWFNIGSDMDVRIRELWDMER